MDNYQQACGHTTISIIECMILFGYTDNQGILLAKSEPWGSSFWGSRFPVGMSFPQIPGIQLQLHSPAQDGVLLSRQSLFPPSKEDQVTLFQSQPVLLTTHYACTSDVQNSGASILPETLRQMNFSGGSAVKNLTASPGDPGLIPGLGRSPREENDNPLQYSCLENPHGQKSLAGYSPWGSQSQTRLSD